MPINFISGLKYFKEFEERIPREEIKLLADVVEAEVKKLDSKLLFETCGS